MIENLPVSKQHHYPWKWKDYKTGFIVLTGDIFSSKERKKSLGDFIIQVSARCEGVFAGSWNDGEEYENYPIKCFNPKRIPGGIHSESYRFFHSYDQCFDFYNDWFENNYLLIVFKNIYRRSLSLEDSIRTYQRNLKNYRLELEELDKEFKLLDKWDEEIVGEIQKELLDEYSSRPNG